VVLCEKWASIEALQRHTRGSAALDEFRKQVKDIKLASSYVLLTPAIGD
jgi:quinol monooxygenase YgiN